MNLNHLKMYKEIETDLNEPNVTVFYEDPDRDKKSSLGVELLSH